MSLDIYSWTVIGNSTVIKKTDSSVFMYNGTTIPVRLRYFFEIESMSPEDDNIPIILEFNKTKYEAYITCKGPKERPKGITQLFWYKDLEKVFNDLYPDVIETEAFPELFIHKINKTYYRIELTGEIVESGVTDLETLDLRTIIEVPGAEEGRRIQYFTTRYERKKTNRDKAIKKHGLRCQICDFSFEDSYGELGKGFIEVHHTKPLYSLNEAVDVNPETDMICICANCHRMIHHRKGEILTLEDMRKIVALMQNNKIRKKTDDVSEDNPRMPKTDQNIANP